MNFELFIAKRIISGQPDKKNKTKPLVGTSILAIALGLTVMIISVAILFGFKKEITEKLVGFSSHIQITNLDNNNSLETKPIQKNIGWEEKLASIDAIDHFHTYAIKAGIIQASGEMQGIVLKGIDQSYQTGFLADFLVEGQLPTFETEKPGLQVLISQSLAQLLKLKLGDKMTTYFVQENAAARPFVVGGIYNTGLEEFDLQTVFCDLRHIQKVSQWGADEITGYEIVLKSDQDLYAVAEELYEFSISLMAEKKGSFDVRTVREIASGFFDFLKLTDLNVWVILTIMVLVSGFNMVSGLLILILNRTHMIGILKALGANNSSLRRVFLYQAAYIISIGLVLGNLLGLLLCWLQDHFKLIPLKPASYFVDAVPISLQFSHIMLLNVGALLITLLMLLLPSGIISSISPDKTIKFD